MSEFKAFYFRGKKQMVMGLQLNLQGALGLQLDLKDSHKSVMPLVLQPLSLFLDPRKKEEK